MGVAVAFEGAGGQQPPEPGAAWRSLVDAELAFARAASGGRVSDAFLGVLAPEGILFRPGPVQGRPATEANPTPPGQRLEWHPRVAAVSSSGDLGFTSGPYVFRATPTDTIGGTGHFLSVWTRAGVEPWRLALDVGTPHPPLLDHFVEREAVPVWTAAVASTAPPDAAAEMVRADDRLSEMASSGAIADAATLFGTRETLAYRGGVAPVRGVAPLREAAVPGGSGWSARRAGSGSSAAQDLGYTYGSWTHAEGRIAYWVRVWRRTPDGWKVAASLLTPAG